VNYLFDASSNVAEPNSLTTCSATRTSTFALKCTWYFQTEGRRLELTLTRPLLTLGLHFWGVCRYAKFAGAILGSCRQSLLLSVPALIEAARENMPQYLMMFPSFSRE
jgi:hypothetical protein